MFRIPQPYICPACQTRVYSTDPDSTCMKCFSDFIAKHVPKVIPDPKGKPFDPNKQIQNC